MSLFYTLILFFNAKEASFFGQLKTLDLPNILSFTTFAIVTALTPGPNNILLSVSGTNFGLRQTLPHICGVVFGFTLIVVLSGFGLGWLLMKFPFFQGILKVFGMLVILYLARKIWRLEIIDNSHNERPMFFHEAFLFQWVNPKGILVILTAISTYTNTNENFYETLIVVTSIFFLVAWGSALIWTLSGVLIGKFLKTGRRQSWFNRISALLLVATILPVLVQL